MSYRQKFSGWQYKQAAKEKSTKEDALLARTPKLDAWISSAGKTFESRNANLESVDNVINCELEHSGTYVREGKSLLSFIYI